MLERTASAASAAGRFAARLLRAARLDARLYADVRADRAATAQAVAVVALVGLAHGSGSVLRALPAGWGPGAAFLVAVVAEVAFWATSASAIYLVGRYALGAGAAYGQVLRPLGFACTPGLFILLASLATGVGAEAPAVAAVGLWRLAAYLVAVRQALGVGVGKSAAAGLVGMVAGLLAVGALAGALWRLLEPA
jgi:hypothetical protein